MDAAPASPRGRQPARVGRAVRASNVVSLAEARARREGWEPVDGDLETKVFQIAPDRYEVRIDDTCDEVSWHVNRAWLEALHAKLGRVLGI